MENYTENQQVVEERSGGMFGAVASVVGGLAAGLGGMLATVNHGIAKNLRKGAPNAVEVLKECKEDFAQASEPAYGAENPVAGLRQAARRHYESGLAVGIEDEALRADISNPKSVIGGAFRQARNKQPYDKKNAQQIRHRYEAMDHGHVEVKDDIASIIVEDELKMSEKAISRTGSHTPIAKRLLLDSELHLSKGQKTAAVLAFAATTAVAAGAIHYGVKHYTRGKEDTASNIAY